MITFILIALFGTAGLIFYSESRRKKTRLMLNKERTTYSSSNSVRNTNDRSIYFDDENDVLDGLATAAVLSNMGDETIDDHQTETEVVDSGINEEVDTPIAVGDNSSTLFLDEVDRGVVADIPAPTAPSWDSPSVTPVAPSAPSYESPSSPAPSYEPAPSSAPSYSSPSYGGGYDSGGDSGGGGGGGGDSGGGGD